MYNKMENKTDKPIELKNKLSTLTVFKTFLESSVGSKLMTMLSFFDLRSYSDFVIAIYEAGGDLGLCVQDYIRSGDNLFWKLFFSRHNNKTNSNLSSLNSITDFFSEENLPEEIISSCKNDLSVLQEVSQLTEKDFDSILEDIKGGAIDLPKWRNTVIDTEKEFTNLVKGLSTEGYGIFYGNNMFNYRDGIIKPIPNADYQNPEELHGYERERELVMKNTEAFVNGNKASNVLLYGDAGTGKSTTVKTCAAYYANKGLRLVEFGKNQVHAIPEVAETLSSSPLRFIFFIDDLTFNEDDDNFYALKGILEGNVSGTGNNILIYATSNRRHLIKESMSSREGDDLHLNDTLQETMSLSARFGLTITFMKPEKDLYLSIVKKLAEEQGLVPDDDLLTRAEAFAIRANGRSPRTAKQFVILAKNGLR